MAHIIFPSSLGTPVRKFIKEQDVESNPMQRRVNQLVEVQQIREGVFDKTHIFQDKIKNIFDRRTKLDDFQPSDLVLKWDAQYEDKGKYGKFDHLWKGPYKIETNHGENTYILQEMNGDFITICLVNGYFMKHYST